MIKLKNKKLHKNQKRLEPFQDNINYTKFIIVVISVFATIAGIYLYTGFFITGELRNNDESEETISLIQYNEILVGSIFTRNEDAYHVLIMNHNDRNFSLVNGLASTSELPLYNVDTAKTLNQVIVADTNHITHDLNTLKVTDPTLLLIKNGRVNAHASGLEEIRNFLND